MTPPIAAIITSVMIMFLELAERAEPIEDIVDEAELITDDDDDDDDGSTIMNIDYIIIHRTLLYILNEYKRANISMARSCLISFKNNMKSN
jgi:hypothetical protein